VGSEAAASAGALRHGPRALVLAAILAGACPLACYDWIPIQPTALPDLIASRSGTVEREDGTTFEIEPPFKIRVRSARGWSKFSEPVASRLAGVQLAIEDADQPARSFSLRDPLPEVTDAGYLKNEDAARPGRPRV
jgi:hypothetical protein